MKRIIYVLSLILILNIGCKRKSFNQIFTDQYKEGLSLFEDSIVAHFPRSFSRETNGLSIVDLKGERLVEGAFSAATMINSIQYSNEKYKKLRRKFITQAKERYLSKDTTLLLVFPYSNTIVLEGKTYYNTESPYLQNLAKNNLKKSEKLPIPLFDLDYKDATICGLSEDFEILVLDAKPGKYIEDKYLYDSSECLPYNWVHGFSRGVALSDKDSVVIYWVLVW